LDHFVDVLGPTQQCRDEGAQPPFIARHKRNEFLVIDVLRLDRPPSRLRHPALTADCLGFLLWGYVAPLIKVHPKNLEIVEKLGKAGFGVWSLLAALETTVSNE
jgi:hypothetical protein